MDADRGALASRRFERQAARIRRDLQLEVLLRTLFENASVRALARALDRSGARVSTRDSN